MFVAVNALPKLQERVPLLLFPHFLVTHIGRLAPVSTRKLTKSVMKEGLI